MKHIGDLFEKYKKNLKAPQASVIKQVTKVIGEVTNLPVTEKYVQYTVSTKTVHISAPSILKQEILLQKTEILKQLRMELGEQSAPKTII